MGKLDVQSPVPSDIVIAQAVKPIHIADVAKSIGLLPDEYDLYGTTKAKVTATQVLSPVVDFAFACTRPGMQAAQGSVTTPGQTQRVTKA